MPRTVTREDSAYTIEWDDDIGVVMHTWEEFVSGAEFRSGCAELADVIEEKGARKLLVDTSGIEAHDDADKAWLQEEWVPRVAEIGLEYSAQVHADSVISQMEMEEFDEEADDDNPLDTFVTGDVGEAREWLAQQ